MVWEGTSRSQGLDVTEAGGEHISINVRCGTRVTLTVERARVHRVRCGWQRTQQAPDSGGERLRTYVDSRVVSVWNPRG